MQKLVATLIVTLSLVVAGATLLAGPSNAQETSCPAGSVPSEDGSACVVAPVEGDSDGDSDSSGGVNENIVTTTSCLQGVLSDDGTTCIVPRIDAAPATGTTQADAPTEAPVPAFTG